MTYYSCDLTCLTLSNYLSYMIFHENIFTAWTSYIQLIKLLCMYMLFSEWYFHSLDLTYSTIQITLWLHVIPEWYFHSLDLTYSTIQITLWLHFVPRMIFSKPGPHIFNEPNYFLIAHYSLNDIFTVWTSHIQRTRLLFDCTLFPQWYFHSLDLTYSTIQITLWLHIIPWMIFSQSGPHIFSYISKLLCDRTLFPEWYFHSLGLTYSTIQTTLWLHVIPWMIFSQSRPHIFNYPNYLGLHIIPWMIFSQSGPHIFNYPNYFVIAHYSLNDIFAVWTSHIQLSKLLCDCTLFPEWYFHSLDLTYSTIQITLWLHIILWMIFSQSGPHIFNYANYFVSKHNSLKIFPKPGPHIFNCPNYFVIAHYSLNGIFTAWASHIQLCKLLFE